VFKKIIIKYKRERDHTHTHRHTHRHTDTHTHTHTHTESLCSVDNHYQPFSQYVYDNLIFAYCELVLKLSYFNNCRNFSDIYQSFSIDS